MCVSHHRKGERAADESVPRRGCSQSQRAEDTGGSLGVCRSLSVSKTVKQVIWERFSGCGSLRENLSDLFGCELFYQARPVLCHVVNGDAHGWLRASVTALKKTDEIAEAVSYILRHSVSE